MTQEYRTDLEPAGFEAQLPTTSPTGSDESTGRAAQAADAGKQAAQDVAATATDKAKDVASETKKQARDVLGEARTQLQDQASTQHQNAVSGLKSLATELKSMSDNADGDGTATGLVGQAGDRVHSAASWLESREPGQLVDEVRDFARRRPAAFLVGALVAGVVAGRLTRGVVDEHRDDSSDGDSTADSAAGYVPTHETPFTVDDSARYAPEISLDQPVTPSYGVPSTPRNPA